MSDTIVEKARAEALALAERAGIDMMDDHDQFIDDLKETLLRFAVRANVGADPLRVTKEMVDAFRMDQAQGRSLESSIQRAINVGAEIRAETVTQFERDGFSAG